MKNRASPSKTPSAACANGSPQSCTPGAPELERCDGLDNDCDGVADNGFDKQTDVGHCGGCNNDCGAGQACNDGNCECADPNLEQCGNNCVDTQTDPNNCGQCGNNCGSLCSCVVSDGAPVCRGPLGLCFF